ncbi:MAG: hypothetical protein GY933_22875 [Hyphomicrobiales bacterium]|nr:hypothetical protein [Hyphomicrobiales bacterium]
MLKFPPRKLKWHDEPEIWLDEGPNSDWLPDVLQDQNAFFGTVSCPGRQAHCSRDTFVNQPVLLIPRSNGIFAWKAMQIEHISHAYIALHKLRCISYIEVKLITHTAMPTKRGLKT